METVMHWWVHEVLIHWPLCYRPAKTSAENTMPYPGSMHGMSSFNLKESGLYDSTYYADFGQSVRLQ